MRVRTNTSINVSITTSKSHEFPLGEISEDDHESSSMMPVNRTDPNIPKYLLKDARAKKSTKLNIAE